MAGSWVSIKVLHCCSIEAPRRLPRVRHSSLKNCTIWSSVVSLVMKLSRAEMRKKAAFILLVLFVAFLQGVIPM